MVAKQLTMGSGASGKSNNGAASGKSNSPRTTSGDEPPTGHALTPMRFMPDTAIYGRVHSTVANSILRLRTRDTRHYASGRSRREREVQRRRSERDVQRPSGDAPPTGHDYMPGTAISAWAEALDGCRKYRVYPGHPLDLNARGRTI